MAAASGLAGCASSKVVRAPINAAAPCPGAQFLYTDWTERGRGNVAVYRCGEATVAGGEAAKPEAGQDPSVVTRRP